MRKLRILVVAALMSVPLAGLTATPAQACAGLPCDVINYVCAKAFKGAQCVG
ncbi:MAG: hypothetical protein M3134_11680 [Actinomycetota bacterium]|nr:hypothetical protein [Actinomycetota bacterium]